VLVRSGRYGRGGRSQVSPGTAGNILQNEPNCVSPAQISPSRGPTCAPLHEQIGIVLASRITAEKQQLEQRLIQLNSGKIGKSSVTSILSSNEASSSKAQDRPRRKYPKVFPKYQNPAVPAETWSGRGRQPRWLVSALKTGRTIKEFEIVYTDDRARR
jgi:DNA-binding protein H-NS